MPMLVDDEIADSLAELVERLGDVPLSRIRRTPPPGTATEADVLAAEAAPRKRLCELIDGTLVEKAMSFEASFLAVQLVALLNEYVRRHRLGVVVGADGMLRLWPGRVRIPDVTFISWDRLPGRRVPTKPIPEIGPELAVEVLSPGNTRKEMEQKRKDYFRSGTRLLWVIDPKARTVEVFKSARSGKTLTAGDTLDGGAVLRGFRLPLADLFGTLDERG